MSHSHAHLRLQLSQFQITSFHWFNRSQAAIFLTPLSQANFRSFSRSSAYSLQYSLDMYKTVPLIFIRFLSFYVFIYFWLHNAACRYLAPRPGIELMSPALDVGSLSHWTIRREVPHFTFKNWVPEKITECCVFNPHSPLALWFSLHELCTA